MGLVSKVQEREKFINQNVMTRIGMNKSHKKYISWFKSNGSLVIRITTQNMLHIWGFNKEDELHSRKESLLTKIVGPSTFQKI